MADIVEPAFTMSVAADADHGATGDRPQLQPSTSKKRVAVSKPRMTGSQLGEHPKYLVMIADAIKNLKERGGSSRQAILKFVVANYKVGSEVNKINGRIKVALKSGVNTGSLRQAKGTGAAGSFRLGDRKKSSENERRSKITKVERPVGRPGRPVGRPVGRPPGKSPSQKSKTAARKPKSVAKSPAKKTAAAKKAKSPAHKLKAGANKITAPRTKPKTPANKSMKPKKPAKIIGATK